MDESFDKRIKFAQIFLFILLVLGVWDSIKLFQIDIELWGSIREIPSFCNVSEFINCDAVSMSSYSMLLGFPNSLLGILYYSVLLAVAAVSFFPIGLKTFLRRFIYASSVVSVIANIFLAYVSLVEIKSICILCWLSYLLNIGILVLSWVILGENPLSGFKNFITDFRVNLKSLVFWKKREFGKPVKLILISLVLGAAVLIAFIRLNAYFQERTRFKAITQKEIIGYFESLPKYDVEISKTVTAWGSLKPKVSVVEFSDFMCPFCRKGAFIVKNILTQYKDRVELIFKNYPMDSSCNKMIGRSLHPMACLLSKAAICADKKGKFWRFHDLLFENSKNISRGDILEMAEKEDINKDEFEKCLDSGEVQKMIDVDIDDANKLNVNATPSFLINGRLIIGLPAPKMLSIILEHELSK